MSTPIFYFHIYDFSNIFYSYDYYATTLGRLYSLIMTGITTQLPKLIAACNGNIAMDLLVTSESSRSSQQKKKK